MARLLARGVCRALSDQGLATLTEFTLISGRRVDVMGLDRAGKVTIVEIKSSLPDFRSDRKWREYIDFCDRFFFAVPEGFPREILPADCGLMVADGFGVSIVPYRLHTRFDLEKLVQVDRSHGNSVNSEYRMVVLGLLPAICRCGSVLFLPCIKAWPCARQLANNKAWCFLLPFSDNGARKSTGIICVP